MRALIASLLIGCSLSVPALAAEGGKKTPPPVYAMRELVLDAIVPEQGRVTRRIRIGIPKGWTGERDPNGRSLKLAGPDGEGMILVAGALHPSQLTPYLTDLKNAHPSAAPSPPQPMTLPGVYADKGERATRFTVTGREVGEMVMVEKREAIVLVVTVVAPEVWPEVQKMMEKAYATLEVLEGPPPQAAR
jgi:hypothetical protein